MQIMIDTDTDSPQTLRITAALLINFAALKEGTIGIDDNAPVAPTNIVPPPPPPADATVSLPPTANLAPPPPPTFQQSGNILPFVAPPTFAIAPGAEVDTAGVPFDARIHQKTKGKKADGTWKVQKGLDKNIVSQVMAQIGGSVAPMPVAPPQPTVFVPPPPAQPASVPSIAPSGNVAKVFGELMMKISGLRSANRLSAEQVGAALQAVGLTKLEELIANPDKLESVEGFINAFSSM